VLHESSQLHSSPPNILEVIQEQSSTILDDFKNPTRFFRSVNTTNVIRFQIPISKKVEWLKIIIFSIDNDISLWYWIEGKKQT
jgi:hypothetical protein